MVAVYIRAVFQVKGGLPDLFNEKQLFKEWSAWMVKLRGGDLAVGGSERLALFTGTGSRESVLSIYGWYTLHVPKVGDDDHEVAAPHVPVAVQDEPALPPAPEAGGIQPHAAGPAWKDYVVCYSGYKHIKRLHRVGSCFRVPGVHYSCFKSFGTECPNASAYEWVCRDCWPVGGGVEADPEEASGEDSSSSEDSDTAGEAE